MVRKEAPSGEEAWADGAGCNAKEHGQIPLLPLCDVHNIVLGPPSLKRDSRSCVYIYEFDYVASYTIFFKDMCKQSYAYTSYNLTRFCMPLQS